MHSAWRAATASGQSSRIQLERHGEPLSLSFEIQYELRARTYGLDRGRDFVRVSLTREGKESGQGVGHLEDGSMVVVNGGVELVGGPEVMLQVTSVVPTAAGRLLFARPDTD